MVRNFARLGWPVIPLNGDFRPQAAKAPALPAWRAYQHRRPGREDLRRWFDEQGHTAAGVVLGKISGLLVLDLDSEERAEAFVRECPDLAQTFTVRSGLRGLPHYYFRAPAGMDIPGRNGEGAELRSSGQYVVAPGSRIGGATWRVIDDREPRILTRADLNRLLRFVRPTVPQIQDQAVTELPAASTETAGWVAPGESALLRHYAHLAGQMGRNNALFAVGCWARDYGWSLDDLMMVLVPAHVHFRAADEHPAESAVARRQEARATLASVYSRPARPVDEARQSAMPGLPNAVREKLLQLGLERVARVLDGLLLAGFRAGQRFTAAQAQRALTVYGLGRNAIRAALKAVFGDASPASPLDPPTTPANAAKRCAEETKQCLFGRVANPVKTPGRPAEVYVVPAIGELCDRLALTGKARTLGDALRPEDLASPAAYRLALHTALIRRAPGRYPRRWQARRLGISAATVRRYERRAGVQVTPVYQSTPLGWRSINRLLTDEPPPGRFIEDEAGRRYPALPSLARRLLAQGRQLMFRRQDANHYRLGSQDCCGPQQLEETPLFEKSGQKLSHLRRVAPQSEGSAPVVRIDVVAVNCSGPQQSEKAPLFEKSGQKLSHLRRVAPQSEASASEVRIDVAGEKCSGPQHFAGDAGERLYATLRQLDPNHALTRRLARRVVQAYGAGLVQRGLDTLASRANVRRPAGFLLAWLRAERPAVKAPVQRRQAAAREDSAAWIERLRQSPYLDCVANADDIRRVNDKLISE